MRHIILSLAFILSCCFSLLAQDKFFSDNPQEFISEMDAFMNKNKQDKMKVAFDAFKKHFESDFNPSQQKRIQEVCNAMAGHKMQNSVFLKYLEALDQIVAAGQEAGKVEELNKTCLAIMADIENRQHNDFKRFLDFSHPFYASQSIRKSAGSEWRVETSGYNVEYKDKELAIVFKNADLYGIRKKDSIVVSSTNGKYYPFTDIWKGEKGQVSWPHAGMEGVVAKLGAYEFEVKKNAYACEDATLVFPKYFGQTPVKGRFEDRVVVSSGGNPTYPRFESFEQDLVIDNIGEGIKYKGGFRLHGITAYGYGNGENRAAISIYASSNNRKVMTARSEQFAIRQGVQRIAGEQTEVALYFGKDSIYHPSSNIRFDMAEKHLNIKRGDRGADRYPFFDSYHNIRLDADNLDWAIEGDTIIIGKKTIGIGGGNDKVAKFESFHYFSESDYTRMQGISSTNPIATIMAHSAAVGSDVLDADKLAKRINPRFDISSINTLLYDLVSQGFIEYDKETQTVYVQEKLRHYAKAAVKKTDYDNVNVVSRTKDTNAYLYLDEQNENPFDIKDVGFVEISDAQKVAFKPMDKRLFMKKNRDMEFSGKIFAGMSSFQGKSFKFQYQPYTIRMDTVLYLDLYENSGELDENDDPIAYSISSRIEGLSGDLLIDAPNNKSSREDIPMFPSISSKGHSFVYYDKVETLDAIYKRDSFYFQLDEFGFDNLDTYMPADIRFDGQLFSHNIFSPFKETILLMEEDKSLGFIHDTPASGYGTYITGLPEGKGLFTGALNLSNAGLQGKGNVKYLASSIDSEDIIFRPHQMNCSARRFDLEEKKGSLPELPQVKGIDVKVNWAPYRDSMYVTPEEAPFAMYRSGLHTLDGTLILTPGGLRGNGLMDWDKASMTSKDFLFGAFSVSADTANLFIKASGVTDELAFDSRNLTANVDFEEGIGRFKANSDEITTSMPYNKYKTSMNEFAWDMNNQMVTFKSEEGRTDSFLSPELDSLQFEGTSAEYDISSSTLRVGGVPFIQSADALIYPETGDVEIVAGGRMNTLGNAKIEASNVTKYHVINRATVNIKGGRDYKANGFYEYNVGDKKQEIKFSNIVGSPVGKGKRSEKPVETRASGRVVEADNFHIDHKTRFKGEIVLTSSERNLYFDGYAKLDLDFPQKNWFTVKSKADKKNLTIAYKTPKNPDGEPLKTGLFIDQFTQNPYPSVMGILLSRKDRAIMDVTGAFKYNEIRDEFIFGDSLKMTKGDYKGNVFVVNAGTKKCRATGEFNIGEGVKFFQPRVVGVAELELGEMVRDSTGQKRPDRQKLSMDAMAIITYQLPEGALKAMVKDLQANMYDVKGIELPKTYQDMLPEVIGNLAGSNKNFKQIMADYSSAGRVSLPKKDKHLFFFSYLPMHWSSDLSSLVSSKNVVGLSQLNGKSIHKMVEAYVEFRMPGTDEDGMHLYIKNPSSSGGHYYYFKYKEGVLQTVSSNPAYNAAIAGAKKKELTVKMGKEGVYTIEPTSDVSAEIFKNRVKNAK